MKLDLNPSAKRALVIVVALVAVGGVAAVLVGLQGKSGGTVNRQSIDSIITNTDNAPTTITAIAGRLSDIDNKLEALDQRMNGIQSQRDSAVKLLFDAIRKEVASNDTRTRAELDRLQQQITAGTSTGTPGGAGAEAPSEPGNLPPPLFDDKPPPAAPEAPKKPEGPPAAPPVVAPSAPPKPQSLAPGDVFASGAAGPTPVPPGPTPGSAGPPPRGGASATGGGLSVRIVRGTPPEATTGPELPGRVFTLPSTSILTGVLLSGLDAPTSAGAASDTVPVLVRLKHEAILPSRFVADVRECNVLLASYGDMSSERALMRAERIACVLKSGVVVESELKGFATGEDGKQGMRGRLVRRDGAFIAQALLVGVLQGAASALGSKTSTQSLSVDGSGRLGASGTQNPLDAFAGGTSKALDRVAQYYLDQAKQIFPVVEVDVGRAVNVVLTEPLTIRLDVR